MNGHILCQLDDLPDNKSKGFALANNHTNETLPAGNSREASVFVIKKEGSIFIYRNHCPHLGLLLEWMPDQFLDRDGEYIQCATHGALFRVKDGICISGPCPGESLTPVPFKIEGKSIMIDGSFLE